MLPLVDKPTIHTSGEEAVASGVSNIILVTGRGKNAIEDYFDVSAELETFLESRGKTEQLEEIGRISSMVNVSCVRQGEPLGLGHAVLVTEARGEPFAVILGDDVIDATCRPAPDDRRVQSRRWAGPWPRAAGSDQVSSYGIVDVEPAPELGRGVFRIQGPGGEAITGRGALGGPTANSGATS